MLRKIKEENMLLQGKKAFITGSSRGIGKEIASLFLKEGCSVWGLCTKPSSAKEELERVAKENFVSFAEVYADASDFDSLVATTKETLSQSGGFDILVNNAGITRDGLSFRMKREDWQKVLDVNLTATFAVCQIVSSDMIKKRCGSIINMSSIVGIHGQGGQVNYAASKGGLIAFSKSLAKEVGSRGVRVNCIAPGFIETDMTSVLKEDLKNSMIETVPMKRAGKPCDVAHVALFLACDLSSYITAQVIGVDGGMGA